MASRISKSRVLPGLLIGLILLGIGLLVAIVPGSPFRSSALGVFVVFVLPLLISVVAFVNFTDHRVWWEVGVVAIWGAVILAITLFVAFLGTMGNPGGYPGATMEFARNLALFLGASLGLGVPYALAGRYRSANPRRTALWVFLAGIAVFAIVNLLAVVL